MPTAKSRVCSDTASRNESAVAHRREAGQIPDMASEVAIALLLPPLRAAAGKRLKAGGGQRPSMPGGTEGG